MKKLFLLSFTALFIMSCGKKKEEPTQPEIDYNTETASNPTVETSDNIVLKANDDMRFDKTNFTVKVGEEITLLLMNVGEMSKESMGHNFVLLKPGFKASNFASEAVSSKSTDYIPTNLKNEIIAHTKLLGGKENDKIKFVLNEPGDYEFLCSFPGHYGTMNGIITAVK